MTASSSAAALDGDLPILPAWAGPWLRDTAGALGATAASAQAFGHHGLLRIDDLHLTLHLLQEDPAPQWLAMGFIGRPPEVSAALWVEALLRVNCAVMGMAPATFGLDEEGTAMLIRRIPADHHGNTELLTDDLDQMACLATALLDSARAVQEWQSGAAPPPAAANASRSGRAPGRLANLMPGGTQPEAPTAWPIPAAQMEAAAAKAFAADWHRPLIEAAVQAKHPGRPVEKIEAVGQLIWDGRAIDVIADGDGHSLLVTTPIASRLDDTTQRHRALRANTELILYAGCSMALAPGGATLQSRWDATGMEPGNFAIWLAEFAALAAAFDHRANA